MKRSLPKQLYIEIVVALYVLLFLYTAIMKFRDIPFFIGSISHTPVLRHYATLLAGMIPAMEIAIAILLIIPRTRYYGLLTGTGLMGIFTLYVAFILATMKELPCSCGGVLQQLNWKEHLVFNSGFLLAGIVACYWNKQFIMINRRSRIPVI
ncbi:MAG: hypothetical protein IPI68_12055 [Chitinophagaceae bacterium]|jgi:hypothetical protein|nr:hypothetical protein [Chitinophagaceae bacterium]